MVKKTKTANLIHLWWFVAILFVAIGALTFLSVYKTHKITERAESNQSQLIESFRSLRAAPEWKLVTDSLGRLYVDSIKVVSPEEAQRIESLLIENATNQLTEYSGMLVRESQSLNNTLILWATVLTLLSIIFTFLGFMELRDRFSAVEEKRVEMDEVIEKAVTELDFKIQEVYNVLSGVKKKRDEMNVVLMKAQNSISSITDRFEDLSVSAIEDIDEKIKEIDLLKQEIKENERISSYNLSMQSVLLKASEEERLRTFKILTEKINKDSLVSAEKKYELLSDLFINIAKMLEKEQRYDEAIDYFSKALKMEPSYSLYILRGTVFFKNNQLEQSIADYNRAIEIDPNNGEAYLYRGNYYKQKKDTDAAIKDYNKAIELDPVYIEAYYERAESYFEEDFYQKALDDYSTIIEKRPSETKAYCKRGIVYKKLNMIEEALDDFEKCLTLDVRDDSGYKSMAQSKINEIKEIKEID